MSEKMNDMIRAKMILTRSVNCLTKMIELNINPMQSEDKNTIKQIRNLGESSLSIIKTAMSIDRAMRGIKRK
jgi:DNA-directed RNA polymerase alpha subunit